MEPLYKCVWMSAGVLSFRLCDRGYDCDHCLVDQALREGSSPPVHALHEEAAEARGAPKAIGGLRYSRTGFYHPSHLCVRVSGLGNVHVGVDDLGRRLLGSLQELRVPDAGANVGPKRRNWVFLGDAGEVVLPCPVSGKVLSVNRTLVEDPRGFRKLDRAHAWLARVRPDRLQDDLSRLLYGKRTVAWLREELERVRDLLVEERTIAFGSVPDGGTLDLAVLDHIEPEVRRRLIEERMLRSGERRR
ncbi:MAG: hypothetical protein ACE15D_06795 [Candidatus Eisenbacteria bacterium]